MGVFHANKKEKDTKLRLSFWLLSFLASCLLISLPAFAASPFDLYPLLMDTLCHSDYAAGDSIAAQIEAQYPNHPASMLARVAVKGFFAVDVTGGSEGMDILSALDSVARRAEAWKDHPDEDQATLSFVRGCALFCKGLILSRQGKIFQGVPQVIKARNEFGRVIEMKPDFYDAYLGRGGFRYIKVVFLSKFDPFGLVTNEAEAREDVSLAMEHGSFSRWLAMDLMAWLLPSQKDFKTADSLCAVGLERFPGCRVFLWPVAWSLMAEKNYAETEKVCLDLLHQYQNIPEDHGFEQLWLYDWLVICADHLGRPDDALAYAKAGIAVKRTPFVTEQRKDQLKRLRERINRS